MEGFINYPKLFFGCTAVFGLWAAISCWKRENIEQNNPHQKDYKVLTFDQEGARKKHIFWSWCLRFGLIAASICTFFAIYAHSFS